MKKLHVGRFTALALGMAGIAAIVFGAFVALRTAQAATADTLAVDMDPTTATIDSSATVPVGNDFTFGIQLTAAPDSYQSYASNTQFPAFVSFVSGPVEWGPTGTTQNAGTGLGSAVLCSPGGVVAPNQLYSGCARVSGTQNNTGLTETFTLHCDSDGTGTLHLNNSNDVNSAVATAFGNVNGSNVQQDATTTDATIICGTGASGPTSTPTDTATATSTVAPTDTATPCVACPTDTATATATDTATATNTSVASTSTSTATATNTSTASTATVRTATPTPGTPTAAATNTPSTGGGTAVPTTPGGGQGGAVGTPTKPGGGQGAGVTLPNTGNGGGHGSLWFGTWIILAGIIVTAAGGGLYLRQRKA